MQFRAPAKISRYTVLLNHCSWALSQYTSSGDVFQQSKGFRYVATFNIESRLMITDCLFNSSIYCVGALEAQALGVLTFSKLSIKQKHWIHKRVWFLLRIVFCVVYHSVLHVRIGYWWVPRTDWILKINWCVVTKTYPSFRVSKEKGNINTIYSIIIHGDKESTGGGRGKGKEAKEWEEIGRKTVKDW